MNAPMTMPPFPANPNTGDYFQGWVWNGAQWVPATSGGQRIVVQVFTASGVYTPSPGLTTAVVECIGGGGAGGFCLNYNAADVIAAGGGGSGGYSRKTLDASLVAGGVVVTVGVGGDPTQSQPASNGTATSFGALCVANGGFGGTPNNATNVFGDGADGGNPGIGDVAMPGTAGLAGRISGSSSTSAQGGAGGAMWGGTTVSHNTAAGQYLGGANGWGNSGAGGGGAIINQVPTTTIGNVSGGQGGSGICMVTEYCLAGSGFYGGGGCAPIPSDGSCGGWTGGWQR